MVESIHPEALRVNTSKYYEVTPPVIESFLSILISLETIIIAVGFETDNIKTSSEISKLLLTAGYIDAGFLMLENAYARLRSVYHELKSFTSSSSPKPLY